MMVTPLHGGRMCPPTSSCQGLLEAEETLGGGALFGPVEFLFLLRFPVAVLSRFVRCRPTFLRAGRLAPARMVSQGCSLLPLVNLTRPPTLMHFGVSLLFCFCNSGSWKLVFIFLLCFAPPPICSSASCISFFLFSVWILKNWFALAVFENKCQLNLPQLPHK